MFHKLSVFQKYLQFFLYKDNIVIDQRVSSGHSEQDDHPESKLLAFWE